MTTKVGGAYIEIRADDKYLKGDLDKAHQKVSSSTDQMQGNVSKAFNSMAVAAAASVTAIGYSLVKLTTASIAAASALEEVSSKYSVVFEGQINVVDRWADNLVEKYAMSTRESKKYLSSVQDLLVPMGMQSQAAAKLSNEIVKLAADLGSFNDLPTEEVMRNIQSALTGEYESMKKYGVVLNAVTVQQEALNMGLAKTKDELTAGHKAQAAYQLIVESSTAALGDMERTADGYANTSKRMTAEWEDFTAALGEKFLPTATKVKGVLADILDSMTKAIKGPSLSDQLYDLAESISLQIDMLERRGNWFKDYSKQIALLKANLQAVKNVAEDTYSDFGSWDSGIENANESLDDTNDKLSEILEKSNSIVDVWGNGYDIDYGNSPVQRAIDEMLLKRNNEQIAIKNSIALQKEMDKAIEDTYNDYGTSVDGYFDEYNKSQESSTKFLKKELEDQLDACQHVYDEIHDINASMWRDFIDGGNNAFDIILNKAKDVFAQILATWSAQITMNVVQSVAGGVIGNVTGGASGSYGLPSFSGMSNVPGMGWLGSTIPGTASASMLSAGASQGMLYPGGASGAVPGGFGGVTWGSALGAGAIGGLGYSMLGGAIGLPQSQYSGMTAGLGAAGMSAYGGSLASFTGIGALGGPVGIAAGAILGGLAGSLLGGDDPDPKAMLFHAGQNSQWANHPEVDYNAKWQIGTSAIDMSSGYEKAVTDYFVAKFEAMDDALDLDFNSIVANTDFSTGFMWAEDGKAIERIENSVFESIRSGLLGAMGLDSSVFSEDFFKEFSSNSGLSLLDSLAGFADMAEGISDFAEQFDRQITEFGESTFDAVSNVAALSGIMGQIEDMNMSASEKAMLGVNAEIDTMVATMEALHATSEQVTQALDTQTQMQGAYLTGLTDGSLAQVLSSGGSVSDTIAKSMRNMMSVAFAETLMDDYFEDFNRQMARAFAEGGQDAALAVYNSFDFTSVEAAIENFMQGFETDIDVVTNSISESISSFIDSVVEYAQNAYDTHVENLENLLEAAQAGQESLENTLANAKSAYITALQDEIAAQSEMISAAQDLYTEWTRTADSLIGYKQRLGVSNAGMDLPDVALQKALTAFRSADPNDLPTLSDALLTAAKSALTDPQEYGKIFTEIKSRLDESIDEAVDQVSLAEEQIRLYENQVSILNDQIDGINSIGQEVRTLQELEQSFYAAQTTFNQSSYQADIAYYTASLAKLGQLGNSSGAQDTFALDTITKLKDAWPSIQDSTLFKIGKNLLGFADGGIASGPTSGYSATLHGTELIVPMDNFGKPGTVSTRSDDNELKDLIRALISAVNDGNDESSQIRRVVKRWDAGQGACLTRTS